MGLLQRLLGRGITWPLPNLRPGESVLVEERANWSRHGVARGGTLYVTEQRLIFEPNSAEAVLGLAAAEWARSDLVGADLAPRGGNPFSGALRRRLRVHLRAGRALLFVVREPQRMIAALDAGR